MAGVLDQGTVDQARWRVTVFPGETLAPSFVLRMPGQLATIAFRFHDMDAGCAEKQVVDLGGPVIASRQDDIVEDGKPAAVENVSDGVLALVTLNLRPEGPPDRLFMGREAGMSGVSNAASA
ncbi:hypothetical protein AOE01nite_35050 [Acetobacter oeni]|uniref:Uncharacterized protein n=1 Tax=Acetobacter oeni TaxID=304077 RepID=A0A511XQP3_9PROT|nr:hypothetical protein AOE01nite_35050 [Acetobacter oeni]